MGSEFKTKWTCVVDTDTYAMQVPSGLMILTLIGDCNSNDRPAQSYVPCSSEHAAEWIIANAVD